MAGILVTASGGCTALRIAGSAAEWHGRADLADDDVMISLIVLGVALLPRRRRTRA